MPEGVVFSNGIEGGIPFVRSPFLGSNLDQPRREAEPADSNLFAEHQVLGIQVIPADLSKDAAVGDQHIVYHYPVDLLAGSSFSNADGFAGLVR